MAEEKQTKNRLKSKLTKMLINKQTLRKIIDQERKKKMLLGNNLLLRNQNSK